MYIKVRSDYLGELHAFEYIGDIESLNTFLGKKYSLAQTHLFDSVPSLCIVDLKKKCVAPLPIFETFWVFKSVRTQEFMGFSLDLSHFSQTSQPPSPNISVQKMLTEKYFVLDKPSSKS